MEANKKKGQPDESAETPNEDRGSADGTPVGDSPAGSLGLVAAAMVAWTAWIVFLLLMMFETLGEPRG